VTFIETTEGGKSLEMGKQQELGFKGGTEQSHDLGDKRTLMEKEEESNLVGMKSKWKHLTNISDKIHQLLRCHESVFLTTLCLFCTVLCVFVTDRHLKLELKVKSLEQDLESLENSKLKREEGEERLMRNSYLARQMSGMSDTHWGFNQDQGGESWELEMKKRVRRSSRPEEIRLSDTACTCVGLPGPPGQHGFSGLPGAKGDSGEKGQKGDFGSNRITRSYQSRHAPRRSSYTKLQGGFQYAEVIAMKGEPGLRGFQGPPGPPGANGTPGQKGQNGNQGLIGQIGPTGPVGEFGKLGLPGSKGLRGYPGLDGVLGQKGEG